MEVYIGCNRSVWMAYNMIRGYGRIGMEDISMQMSRRGMDKYRSAMG
jgi:hypothetical protein